MTDGAGRAVPNTRARHVMLAIQDVMGLNGLITVLRQAGLQRYVDALPPSNGEPGLAPAEYAALMQAIENYYGRGARGTLTRIGFASFKRLLAARPLQAAAYQLLLRILPLQSRRVTVLKWLAREMAHPNGRVTVHVDDRRIHVVDHVSDATTGRQRDTEICWLTLGEIEEALKWGTGLEHDVAEMRCRARGDTACRFEVGDPLS